MTTHAFNDTAHWLPLDQLEPGFDANKAATSALLDGTSISITTGDGTVIGHDFAGGTVTWTLTQPDGGLDLGTDPYEAFQVADGLFYVQFHHARTHPEEAVSAFFDLSNGVALCVLSFIGPAGGDGATRVTQQFVPATVNGASDRGPLPVPTEDLVGRRVLWRYSAQHVYEHYYLNDLWYTWHCVTGPEGGQADTDEQTTYRLRPGIYVFAWREKVIPCASVTVADHRDALALRSHGVLFGLNEDETRLSHFTFGAHGSLVGISDPVGALESTARHSEQRRN
ncbi:MoaF C-terminal domain-containing protein [Propionicicella superfundia]|uniref:MoaF C-terminal domain-containing protein n=1 Tax=Propionicicella superfundia TaxID=348582 RepID=UPI000427B967|nr:MoaF C-terminal domain-containing protein [Propionicicella superfundia]